MESVSVPGPDLRPDRDRHSETFRHGGRLAVSDRLPRRFILKQISPLSPIHLVTSTRLNQAAMPIAEGKTVSEAAMDAGPVSPPQISRAFKRQFGQSPRQWRDGQRIAQ
jgi:methylphosphotriester-DNA--protein-cysteine methyltransferase